MEMDVSADEAERPRVDVDGPVRQESDPTPLRDPIGHRGAVDTNGPGHRLQAHTVTAKVGPAPDDQLPQDLKIEIIEGFHRRHKGINQLVLDGRASSRPRTATGEPERVRVLRADADKHTS